MNNLIGSKNLGTYFKNIGDIPLLTSEEEIALVNRVINNNDSLAIQKLVKSQLKFVVFMAKKYLNYGLPLEDLIQEGNIGLFRAIQKFKPDHKVRLHTFAVYHIRDAMHQFIIKNLRIIKMYTTKSQRKLFYNLRRMKKNIEHSSECERADMAKSLNVSIEDVRKMEERLYSTNISYNFSGADENDACYAPENNLYDESDDPAKIIEDNDYDEAIKNRIKIALNKTSKRNQDIVISRNFVEEPKTLENLSIKYDISKERVRQIEKNGINKIKESLEYL